LRLAREAQELSERRGAASAKEEEEELSERRGRQGRVGVCVGRAPWVSGGQAGGRVDEPRSGA
jgi:hypothetical protein